MTAPKPSAVCVVWTSDSLGSAIERAFSNMPAARDYVVRAHGKGKYIPMGRNSCKYVVNGYEVWIHRLRVYEGAKT